MTRFLCAAALSLLLPVTTATAEPVSWVLELSVAEENTEAFTQLMDEMVAGTRNSEPGAVIYEWYRGAAPTEWHVLERYADDAALMAHLGAFGENYAERFLALAAPRALTVYGDPSETARGVLANFGAVHFEKTNGFSR